MKDLELHVTVTLQQKTELEQRGKSSEDDSQLMSHFLDNIIEAWTIWLLWWWLLSFKMSKLYACATEIVWTLGVSGNVSPVTLKTLGVAVFSKKRTFNSGIFQPHDAAAMADALSSRFMSATLLMVAELWCQWRPVLPETSIRTINSQPSMMWPWQLCCQTILVVSCHTTEVKSEVPADYAASGPCWSQTGLCVGSNYLHLQMMSGWKTRPVSGRRTAGGCLCHENTELHVSGMKGGKKEKKPWQRETCGLILLNCLLLFTRTVKLK